MFTFGFYHDVRCDSTSLLNYFLIANKGLSASGQFHHAFVYVAVNTCLRKMGTSSELYDYNRVDIWALRSKFAGCDVNAIYNTSDVDDQLNIVNGNLYLIHQITPNYARLPSTVRLSLIVLKSSFSS